MKLQPRSSKRLFGGNGDPDWKMGDGKSTKDALNAYLAKKGVAKRGAHGRPLEKIIVLPDGTKVKCRRVKDKELLEKGDLFQHPDTNPDWTETLSVGYRAEAQLYGPYFRPVVQRFGGSDDDRMPGPGNATRDDAPKGHYVNREMARRSL